MSARIPSERLRSLIVEAGALPSIRAVCFTGGECFTLGAELDALIALTAERGYEPRCVSNGYWAVTPTAAADRMGRARAAGLRTIHLSTGQMHAAFVPVERIVNAAVAAFDAGIRTSISIEEFKGTSFDWRAIVEHPEIVARSTDPRLDIFLRDWIPHAEGRGEATLAHTRKRSRFRAERKTGCDSILDILTVRPNLELSACCGYPIESMPELSLGSLANRTIAEVVAAADDDLIKFWLHVAGPERMLEFVKRYEPSYQLPTQYAHKCQSCVHLHRDPVAMRVLTERANEVAAEITAAYLRLRDSVLAS